MSNLTPDKNEKDLESLPVYIDTSTMLPGLLVYTIEEIKPSREIPYSTFRVVPRVIVEVYNSGVNQGITLMSYEPSLEKEIGFHKEGKYKVKSKVVSFYSPLTKEQAEYICKNLNEQHKNFYIKMVAKQKQRSR